MIAYFPWFLIVVLMDTGLTHSKTQRWWIELFLDIFQKWLLHHNMQPLNLKNTFYFWPFLVLFCFYFLSYKYTSLIIYYTCQVLYIINIKYGIDMPTEWPATTCCISILVYLSCVSCSCAIRFPSLHTQHFMKRLCYFLVCFPTLVSNSSDSLCTDVLLRLLLVCNVITKVAGWQGESCCRGVVVMRRGNFFMFGQI